jgi:hypothetical protein
VVPGEPLLAEARSSPAARALRAPAWKDRCVLFPSPGTTEAPGLPWFTLVVLGVAQLVVGLVVFRSAR